MTERNEALDISKVKIGSPEFAALNPEQKIARAAQVLDRSYDRYHVDLPDDLHGEWIPNNKTDIAAAREMGFEIDTRFSNQMTIHGENTIGDTIFMIIPKEIKHIHDIAFARKLASVHGEKRPDGTNTGQREEKEYKDGETVFGLPTYQGENMQRTISGEELQQQLKGESK